MLSDVIPGEIILKDIYITVEGIVYIFVNEICPDVEAADKTGRIIEFKFEEVIYPVKADDKFTTIARILVGLGEEVERKFSHLIK